MDIITKIEQDFIKAYRQKEKDKALVLSLLKSALKNAEISQKREKLKEEQVWEIIKRELKQRRESLEEWQKAGREEEVLGEQRAIKILKQYLPAPLSEEEIKKIAQKVISEVKAQSPQDRGRVMGVLMPKLKGRAEGEVVSKIVKELLSASN